MAPRSHPQRVGGRLGNHRYGHLHADLPRRQHLLRTRRQRPLHTDRLHAPHHPCRHRRGRPARPLPTAPQCPPSHRALRDRHGLPLAEDLLRQRSALPLFLQPPARPQPHASPAAPRHFVPASSLATGWLRPHLRRLVDARRTHRRRPLQPDLPRGRAVPPCIASPVRSAPTNPL